jgi:methionyl aminopeptidase
MIVIPKTLEEIELMRESALIVSKTLGMIAKGN